MTQTMQPAATRPSKQLVTHKEAAKYLTVSPKSLFLLVKEGTIPCVRIRNSVRYEIADLDAYCDAAKTR